MKRSRNEEISVYSTSAIDLFCSAMGVFMLICFIALAQIKEETPSEPTPQPPPPEPKPGLPDPMMVAVCEWSSRSDVDLCVRYHALGQAPCWFAFREERRTHCERGFYGGLLHDDKGDGNNAEKKEQWALFATQEGNYEVYLTLFGNSSAVNVTTKLMTEDDMKEIKKRLTRGTTWLKNSPEVLERDYRNALNRGDIVPIGKFVVTKEGKKNKVKIETEP